MSESSSNVGLNLPVGSDVFDFDKFLRQNFLKLDARLLVKTGTAVPTINADFIGQDFIDTTNRKVYKAVAIGTGAMDWVLLN